MHGRSPIDVGPGPVAREFCRVVRRTNPYRLKSQQFASCEGSTAARSCSQAGCGQVLRRRSVTVDRPNSAAGRNTSNHHRDYVEPRMKQPAAARPVRRFGRRFLSLLVLVVALLGSAAALPAAAAVPDGHLCLVNQPIPPEVSSGWAGVRATTNVQCNGLVNSIRIDTKLRLRLSQQEPFPGTVVAQPRFPTGVMPTSGYGTTTRLDPPCVAGFYQVEYDVTVHFRSGTPLMVRYTARGPERFIASCGSPTVDLPPPAPMPVPNLPNMRNTPPPLPGDRCRPEPDGTTSCEIP
jgi:hypothetical protein